MAADLPRTIADASRLIASRALSPLELARAMLERVETLDPVISSFLTVTADVALDQARKAEADIAKGTLRGPLHGIPFGAKDNYDTGGILTTGHSRVYQRRVPRENAAVLDRLENAGAVLMGKLALHELAHGGPSFDLPWPPARNPWNPAHFTAGSSSGSGAALAADLVLFSLGTDTGGSVRGPAALCGLVGLKPSFGVVSRYGVIPNCWSLDHCGPLTRTVEDCAIVMDAISGYDPRDRGSVSTPPPEFIRALRRNLRDVRVGVVRNFWEDDPPLAPELVTAGDEALRVLEQIGARIDHVRIRPMRDYCEAWALIEAPETFSIQRAALTRRPQDFGAVFLERTLIACLIQASDHVEAHRLRGRMIDEMAPVWERFDVLVAPGGGPAPRLDPRLAAWPSINRHSPFAVLGTPAAVVPCGYSAAGLPLSIQFIARPGADAELLGYAHAYEQATLWWTKRRAILDGLTPPAPIVYEPPKRSTSGMDAAIVRLCEQAAASAGLDLADEQLALLCGVAPDLLEMVERVRGAAGSAEPASTFVLPRR